jgi:hypothetical protein
METGHPNHLFGVFEAHHMGNHDSRGIQFQGPYMIAVTSPGYPDHAICVMGLGAEDLAFDDAVAVGHVFHVGPHTVKTAERSNLCHPGVCGVDLDAARNSTGS